VLRLGLQGDESGDADGGDFGGLPLLGDGVVPVVALHDSSFDSVLEVW
jgi:hypothetical protein